MQRGKGEVVMSEVLVGKGEMVEAEVSREKGEAVEIKFINYYFLLNILRPT